MQDHERKRLSEGGTFVKRASEPRMRFKLKADGEGGIMRNGRGSSVKWLCVGGGRIEGVMSLFACLRDVQGPELRAPWSHIALLESDSRSVVAPVTPRPLFPPHSDVCANIDFHHSPRLGGKRKPEQNVDLTQPKKMKAHQKS